jgi:hypothetical protein
MDRCFLLAPSVATATVDVELLNSLLAYNFTKNKTKVVSVANQFPLFPLLPLLPLSRHGPNAVA